MWFNHVAVTIDTKDLDLGDQFVIVVLVRRKQNKDLYIQEMTSIEDSSKDVINLGTHH